MGALQLMFMVLLCAVIGCASPVDERGGEGARPAAKPGASVALEGPRVRVTGPDGRARAGVEVWLVDPRQVQPERAVVASRTLGDWVAASRAIAAEVSRTGDDGVARFQERRPSGLLVACQDGSLFGSLEQTEAAGKRSSLDLRLAPRRSFAVSLVRPDGSPAAGVALTLGVPDPSAPERPFSLPSTATTDASGNAVLYEPPAQATDVLEGLEGLSDRVALVRLASSSLEPIALVGGGATTEARLPNLGKLVVRCAHRSYPQSGWSGLIQLFPAADGSRSDRTLARRLESGEATFEGVAMDEDLRAVVVLSETEQPERFVGTMTVAVRALESGEAERTLDLELDAGLLLHGRLLDESGKPLGGETVDLFVVGDAANSWTMVTDEEGGFRWLLLRPGKKLASIVIGARSKTGRVIERIGAVKAGDTVDLGELTVR